MLRAGETMAHIRSMTPPRTEAQPKQILPIGAIIALAGAAVLLTLSVMIVVPTYSMAIFPLVVGATELSPILVLADLVWCLVANRMLRGRNAVRRATIVLLVAAALVAVRPLTQFTQVAAAASAQLGTEDAPPRYSLMQALRGLPSGEDVVTRAITYAATDGAPLTLLLYALPAKEVRPVVVVLYGGAWRAGEPTQCEDVSRALAARGYAVAAIDYRHAPKHQYPTQLVDVRHSIRLLRDSALSWGLDAGRMALLGRSAGGHLAELAAFAPGGTPVQAVISIYSPYDLVEGYRDLPSPDPIDVRAVLRDFLGGTPEQQMARYREASPSSHVRAGLPPTLLIFGGKDHIIRPAFNRRAASELRTVNVPVVSVEIPWAEHGFDMAPAGLGSQLAFNVIAAFLDRELRNPPKP